jgi:hypothetical protein
MTDEDYEDDQQGVVTAAVAMQWCNHSCRPMIREYTLGMNKRPIVATKRETKEPPKELFTLIEY